LHISLATLFSNKKKSKLLKLGIKLMGVRMKIVGILHDFRIFFIGKGSFYRTLGKARKIPALLL
jgi:hypothetical protein